MNSTFYWKTEILIVVYWKYRVWQHANAAMLLPAGSEADFSSSSSTGSLKTKGGLSFSSAGKKTPSRRYVVIYLSTWFLVCSSIIQISYFFLDKSLILFYFILSSRGAHIRPLPVFKPAGMPTANRDAELYAPYRTPPRAASSTNSSSCNSSPTSRYQTMLSYNVLSIITEQRLWFLNLREFLLSWFPRFTTWIH